MAPKKTPSETRPPATKTTKKVTKESVDGKKKRNKRRVETFSIYIYKVLR